MSVTCAKRLRKEMHKLQTSPPDNDIALHADEDDIRLWKAHIRGPPDTPFHGGTALTVCMYAGVRLMAVDIINISLGIFLEMYYSLL